MSILPISFPRFEQSYARLPETLFDFCRPVAVSDPRCVVWNSALAKELGLEAWADAPSVWSGNELPGGITPLAQAYAGHQFGQFTMLGDGRAHLLGERVLEDGRMMDVQLKGSGRTVFSRGGDGRAALEPMLREYLISEAMHALGIPTTRSLAVVTTGERVQRDRPLPGAILTRVAASHLRVGTFQYAAGCDEPGVLASLIGYAIERHVPEAADAENPALALLEDVVEKQAHLLARWMHVGFVHGVMNTDNMALSGETIDYGPCAFLDVYDPETVFSSIDRGGRYAYGNQPSIALWNLSRFAETQLTALDPDPEKAVERAEAVLYGFEGRFKQHWLNGMRAKLGLFTAEEPDETLVQDLLEFLYREELDYTAFFAGLDPENANTGVDPQWYSAWRARLADQPQSFAEVRERMRRANPRVIPRNHLVEAALNAAGEGDMAPFHALLAVLQDPCSLENIPEKYTRGPSADFGPYVTYCGT